MNRTMKKMEAALKLSDLTKLKIGLHHKPQVKFPEINKSPSAWEKLVKFDKSAACSPPKSIEI